MSFVKYNKYGYKEEDLKPVMVKDEKTGKEIEVDPKQYLAPDDGDEVGFEFVAASEEQLKRAKQMVTENEFKGGRFDVDKNVADMNQEEKAVYDCLVEEKAVDDGQYE